jgi:hypothetical protein
VNLCHRDGCGDPASYLLAVEFCLATGEPQQCTIPVRVCDDCGEELLKRKRRHQLFKIATRIMREQKLIPDESEEVMIYLETLH